MKRNARNRARQKSSASAAAQQVKTDATSADLDKSGRMLVSGTDTSDDYLYAMPDGRLFLWTGFMSDRPRQVTLAEARAWWEKFHRNDPGFAAPFFPEKTAAADFVRMVCAHEREQLKAIPRSPTVERLQVHSGESEYSLLEMEIPIQRAAGLLDLFSQKINLRPNSAWRSTADCGCAELGSECAAALYRSWEEANEISKTATVQAVEESVRRLRAAMRASVTMLELMANSLAAEEGNDDFLRALMHGCAPPSASGYLALASSVVSRLESSFETAVQGWRASIVSAEQCAA